MREVDVLVIGAGPSGLTAAAALARAGAGAVEVLDREQAAGGIPRHSHHLGYGVRDLRRVLTGPEYARRLVDEAVGAGARLRVGVSVTGWDHDQGLAAGQAPRLAVRTTSPTGVEVLSARAVVLATGARERPRSARLVPGARGRGVWTTGELQQAVYLHGQHIGRRAVVVGAEHVSYSAAVTLDHAGVDVVAMVTERPRQQSYVAFRAGAALAYRFPVLTGVRVLRVLGSHGQVEGVEIRHPGGSLEALPCDTVVFTGDWVADHELARSAALSMDRASSGPLVDTGLRTSRDGVYAVGNLVHPVLTADAAALDGTHVARSVLADLEGRPAPRGGPVRLTVERPLVWVAPGLVADPTQAPPRGRLVLWADDFRTAPRVEVHQGDRLLHSVRPPRPLVPGRPYELGAGWLPRVVAGGPDVRISLR